ncbi:MAG TPA: chemotaxis-specific protein-glutamate methyltransferase CheB, partial [Spirochaetota bacterium]|nr:chemotaxis-specific protein-glutamate methyltransferase CheB [Spirochaetota bacterium]
MDRIKVLIVDDSAVMRRFLTDALSGFREIEVVATALDPYIAANKIKSRQPDVITLDIEMPRMDGLTFLSKLMIANPLPVIMVSSLTEKGASETIRALEYGAVDFILKPSMGSDEDRKEFARNLAEKIMMASKSRVKRKKVPPAPEGLGINVEKKHSADVILAKSDPMRLKARSERVIAIGASTGGTEVIDEILVKIPNTLPGIVITQHMPEKFTDAFARRVNEKTPVYVKEAAHGDRLYKGLALVAPGGKHMLLRADSSGYWVEIHDGPPVNRHK